MFFISSKNKPNLSENIIINKSSNNNNKAREYALIAVVVHDGSEAGGHYYAYVKYDNNWFKCDDDRISLVDKAEVFSKKLAFQYIMYQEKSL